MKNGPPYINPAKTKAFDAYIRVSSIKKWGLFAFTLTLLGTLTALKPTSAPTKNTLSAISSVVPEMRWVLLTGTNGTCISNTDCCTNTYCYGLEYTPGSTGDLTSYTTAFFADCISGASPILFNASCVMTSNDTVINGCVDYNLVQIQSSGNNGTIHVDNGIPVIIHQVCFTVPVGATIQVQEDEVTDLTTSIDLDGGGFITEYPEYETHTLTHTNIVTNSNDSSVGSFRHVIECAANNSTITFSPSLMNQTITLTTGEIDIDKNLTISGLGVTASTLSGNNTSVIFHVLPGYELTLKDVSLKDANPPANGGAIYAQGNVTLQNVLLQNNFENGVAKSMTLTNTSLVMIIGLVDCKY